MNIDKFYQSRNKEWETLNNLLGRARQGLGTLSPQEIEILSRLYRAATSDLALAQRDFPQHNLTQYLNQLVASAHAIIYRPEPAAFNRLVEFVARGFPSLFRKTLPFTFAAFLLFFLPALGSAISTAIQPQSATWLLPAGAQKMIPTIEDRELWTDIPIGERPYASSFIMKNNIQVSFLAFSSGLTGGLLTIWVLIMNGLILGSLTGLTTHYGIGFELWTFVIGHGVIELSVIFMAGGSGLMLGWAILHPGLMRRRDALSIAAQDAVRLLIGAVPMLVIAGLIEGFISPAENIPWQVKWSIGLGSGLLLYGYLLLAGREKKSAKAKFSPLIQDNG
jgi:uncharacterized membrane protein SpoIIM required for sporulation